MRRGFWKAAVISIAAYTAAGAIGFLLDFRLTAVAVALLLCWAIFCGIRAIQLRLGGAQNADAPVDERESYGFALGGFLTSVAAMLAMVVITQ